MRELASIIRSIEGKTLETNKRRRTVRAVWSDDSTDHYRTVFHQGGIDTSVFAANPVILFEHGKHPTRAGLPIGNALEWGVEKHRGRNALIGVARFHDDEFSNERFEDYAAGRMRGWSINALPLDASPPTPAERRARPDWNSADTVFREVRLLEVSATALPGNAGTLTLSVERGLGGARAEALRLAMTGSDLRALDAGYRNLKRVHQHTVACWAITRAGSLVKLPSYEKLSIEELEVEIKRLKLLNELCELLAKREEAAKWKAEAERIEAMKAGRA